MIQVWFNGKRMGVLNTSASEHRNSITFVEADGSGGAIREFVYSLNRRNSFIGRDTLLTFGWTVEDFIINQFGLDPTACSVEQDPHLDGYRVSWPLVNAKDIDAYEYLFDLHCFRPD